VILLAPLPVWSVDLALDDGGFVSGGSTGQWEWAVPTVGPTGSGAMWCTNCDGAYLHDTVDWLEIPLPNLNGLAEPTLVLRHWYAIRSGDAAQVEVNGAVVAPAYGYPDPTGGFVGDSVDFVDSAFDLRGFGNNPQVRLVLTADPAMADDGWYLSRVDLYDGDVVPPSVTVAAPPADTQDLVGPYGVSADVVDDRAVPTVTLWYEVDGGAAVSSPLAGPPYAGAIPGQPPGSVVGWWIEASDGANVGRWPASGESTFRVFLAAPENLAAVGDGRAVADQVELAWDPPVSPHEVLGYSVYREGTATPLVEVDSPDAVVPLAADAPQTFTVTARYDVGEGDASDPLTLDYEVPALDVVDPDRGYQGDELYVAIEGRSLYLLQGASTVDLGPDVEVLGLDVRDVGRAVAHLRIADGAALGPVDLVVDGPSGSYAFPAAFDVLDGADAPAIRSVDPEAVGQGETVDLDLTATVDFAGPVTVTTDGDLLVTGAVTTDRDQARVSIAASTRARVGVHTLTLDDGQRLYTADLQVDERLSHLTNGCCSTSPSPARGAGPLAALALAWRARRRARPRSSR
jgi:hypothetical protein